MNDPIDLLLVEDNPGDVRLIKEALRDAFALRSLSVMGDGHEALRFLRREGEHAGAPRPGLVILDLNLPRVDGRELLREIKSDPDLRRIPVVVLSSSAAEKDVRRCYELHANAYITKPADFDGIVDVLGAIGAFWLSAVRLPPG